MSDGSNGSMATTEQTEALAQFRGLMQAELRALETDVLLERYRFARGIGTTFGGLRDLYHILGYESVLTVAHYRERYERGGVAGTAVDIFPDATWRGEGWLEEDEDPKVITQFEAEWTALDQRLGIWPTLCRVDKLSLLSTYAVLLIGTGDGNLSAELPRGTSPDAVLFLEPFIGGGGPQWSTRRGQRQAGMAAISDIGADATIKDFERDITSPRYGKPKTYQLKRTSFEQGGTLPDVHWSRVIHVAYGCLDDDIYGRPILARPWNLFDDLEKVSGGGAEAFWLRANRGMQLDIDKDIQGLGDPEKADLKNQVEQYVHQLTRVLRTRGVTVKELGSDVANFANPGDFLMSLIAGTTRVPKRILTGSEMGELASTQDRENFRDIVNGRQTGYAAPGILRRLADRLIEYGYLTKPTKYDVKWPRTEVLTENERAAGAEKWAMVNKTMGETIFTSDEIREKWYGLGPLDADQRVELWKADLAVKLAMANKTEGAVLFTDDEIRMMCYGLPPLLPEQKVPITAPERVTSTAPTPPEDVVGGVVLPAKKPVAIVPGQPGGLND